MSEVKEEILFESGAWKARHVIAPDYDVVIISRHGWDIKGGHTPDNVNVPLYGQLACRVLIAKHERGELRIK